MTISYDGDHEHLNAGRDVVLRTFLSIINAQTWDSRDRWASRKVSRGMAEGDLQKIFKKLSR